MSAAQTMPMAAAQSTGRPLPQHSAEAKHEVLRARTDDPRF